MSNRCADKAAATHLSTKDSKLLKADNAFRRFTELERLTLHIPWIFASRAG